MDCLRIPRRLKLGIMEGVLDEVPAGAHAEVAALADVQVDVRTDASVEAIRDTHEQRTTTDPVVSLGSPFFTMSDMLGSRLAP